ncbi:MAG TPA: hydrogenase accessory protein HypB [Thermoplasmatales archaeon]|nr:hydrogenase nickel incorporation protein HypB [Candidatus Thermoplasmatota archaeon]MDD5778937.1 hydrogenase nickel incorporation protein HypB [Candidatus Thermoplasmatota archaeon]HDS59288.1 hydrogenase accessory protein HypB [Thermoplasmatales archaeon]
MHKIEVSMSRDLFAENKKIADANNVLLKKHGVTAVDIMGSIGSGKTLLIERMIEKVIGKKRVGVIVGDVTGDDDYNRIRQHHVPVVNINTGKECHLDAHLIEHALEELDLENIDILFVENIGNLVCPADFALGCDRRGVVISVTEGEDMVRKHPLIFQIADFVVINKVDLARYMDVDINHITQDLNRIAPQRYFLTDARHDQGVDELVQWLIWENE